MEANEVMNNEEVIDEATEEIAEVNSHNGLKTAAVVGLAMVAGGIACEFVVKPVVANFKQWRASRKAMRQQEVVVDDCDHDFEDYTDAVEEQ